MQKIKFYKRQRLRKQAKLAQPGHLQLLRSACTFKSMIIIMVMMIIVTVIMMMIVMGMVICSCCGQPVHSIDSGHGYHCDDCYGDADHSPDVHSDGNHDGADHDDVHHGDDDHGDACHGDCDQSHDYFGNDYNGNADIEDVFEDVIFCNNLGDQQQKSRFVENSSRRSSSWQVGK